MTRPGGARIAVLGGGISGLTAAYRLALRGAEVTLFEAGSELGGLGQTFEAPFGRVDKFYHCILPSDVHLLELVAELGLGSRVRWRRTGMGFIHRGRYFPLNTPLDLLLFQPLRLRDRLRMGLVTLCGLRRDRPEELDRTTAESWLRRRFGDACFETVWKALLRAKFGDDYHRIPALWIWSRLRREKNGQPEVKGALPGGLRELIGALEHALREAGVTVRRKAPVERLVEREGGMELAVHGAVEWYDTVVACLATRLLARMLPDGGTRMTLEAHEVPYQGVVNVVLATDRRLDRSYWTAVVDSNVSFQGIVETTNVIDPAGLGGNHLVYLMNYVPAHHSLFHEDDRDLIARQLAELRTLYPGYASRGTTCARVFRAPFVEPLYPVGYLDRRPPETVVPGRLYLCNTAQIYPAITSWNSCVKQALEVADRVHLGVPAGTGPGRAGGSPRRAGPSPESLSRNRPPAGNRDQRHARSAGGAGVGRTGCGGGGWPRRPPAGTREKGRGATAEAGQAMRGPGTPLKPLQPLPARSRTRGSGLPAGPVPSLLRL